MAKTTLPPIWWPLMDAPDLTPGYCIVCGMTSPTEKHHPVKRSAGEMIDPITGKKRRKPVFELCGFGNNLRNANGRLYCHGMAHANMLHFRNDRGCVEYLACDDPTRYADALESDGWRPICL